MAGQRHRSTCTTSYFRFPVLLFTRPAGCRARRRGADAGGRRAPARSPPSAARCACRPPKRCVPNRPPATGAPSSRRRWSRADLASPAAWCCETSSRHPFRAARLHLRHRLRRGDPDGRPRVHRRDGAPDRDAVLGRRAAGRDGDLRRAAVGRRPARAGAPARASSRSSRSARSRRASAPVTANATWRLPACRRLPRLRRIVDRDGRAIRLPPAGVVLSRRRSPTCSACRAGDRVTLEVLEGVRPVRDACRSPASSTMCSASPSTWTSRRCTR